MTEYIERDKAYDELRFEMCGTGYQSRAVSCIGRIPSADVAPVIKGSWMKIVNTYYPYPNCGTHEIVHKIYYQCNLCRRIENKKEPYCNCGAKMH